MANDDIIARFRLDIEGLNSDINKIKDKLGDVEKGAGKAAKNSSKEFDHFGNTVNKLGQRLIAAFAVERIISFGRAIINTTAEFQKFQAVLTNTLGSRGAASLALKNITDFAAKTPFSVQQLTGAFVKLANQGFKPTVEEMRKLGDLAASTGKDFDQLAEAIIDAQTFEFERLKEVGVRAKKEGDKVIFTFKGVETQTDATSESIRKYILSLGDLEGVSGSMAAISETLGGKISNLGDSYDQLKKSIGEASNSIAGRLVDALKEGLDATTKLIDESNKLKLIYSSGLLTKEEIDKNIGFWTELKLATSAVEPVLNILLEELGKRLPYGGFGLYAPYEDKKVDQYRANIDLMQQKLKDAAKEQNFLTSEQLIKLQKTYDLLLQMGEVGVFDPFTAQRLRELGLVIEEFKQEVEEVTNEEKKTNEVIKTRRQILEDLIKKEELILQKKVGQGKATEQEQGNIFRYKNELESIVNEEERRLKIVSDLLDLKNEEKRLNEAEKNDLEEVNKLLMAKGVLTDDSASKPSARNNEMENQLADNIIDSTQQAARTYAEYVDYLNAQDERRIKALQEFNDKEISLLNDKYNQGLISYEDYTRAVADQQAFADEQRKQLMAKQLQREKVAATFTAVTESAQAILRALNTKPPFNFILAGLVAAQTAIQVSAINSAQVPQFEKGGYIKGKRHKEGGVLIEAEGGEYMVNRQGTARHLEVIEAINNGYFDKLIYQDWVLPALEQQKKEFAKMKNKDFASNLADSLVVKAMIDEDRLINSDKNTRKILMSIDSKLGRNSYINKRNA